MNIALLADDGKKELMVQFCIAYCGILSEHKICATATTGKLVSENTGLPVTPDGGTTDPGTGGTTDPALARRIPEQGQRPTAGQIPHRRRDHRT